MSGLRAINIDQFDVAKRYWAASLGIKLFMFGLGAWAVFVTAPTIYLPQILLILTITSELLQLRSDAVKGQAESLLRTLDLCRSFGLPISTLDRRDIVANIPRRKRKQFKQDVDIDPYFASSEPVGPRKAIEHLQESAWYTRRQAGVMAWVYLALIAGFIAVAFATLIVAIREFRDPQQVEQTVKVVTSWLLLLVSLSMIKGVWAYYKMYMRCNKTVDACEHLLRNEVTEADAIKKWYEYQLARSGSPMLPGWLWKMMRSSLDDAWKQNSERPA